MTRFYSKACQLEISENSDGGLQFKLETINSAQSGSVGTTWEGFCNFEDNDLLFKVRKTIDWRDVVVNDEPEKHVSTKFEIMKAKVVYEGEIIKIKIQLSFQEIVICKIPENLDFTEISSIQYWIVNTLIKKHDLNPDTNIHSDVPKWIISNLLFKEIEQISEEEEKYSLKIEYDLYDEKQIVDMNKPISEHKEDIAILDEKFKIIEFL
ncbi:MAG: hypothetical protein ACTSR3_23010 [Candidatus Helarchaeota archaeon]